VLRPKWTATLKKGSGDEWTVESERGRGAVKVERVKQPAGRPNPAASEEPTPASGETVSSRVKVKAVRFPDPRGRRSFFWRGRKDDNN